MTTTTTTNPPRVTNGRIAAALGLITFVVLRLTSTSIGFVRDEGYYFKAAQEYVGWWQRLLTFQASISDLVSRSVADRYFNYNHEHPALIKTAQGFAWWIWHEVLGIGLHSEGFRIPGPLTAALCVVCTFLLGARMYGRFVGLFAALSWALMPRNFFDAHLATFDVPITAMTVLVVYAYARCDGTWKRAAWLGVAFGLALATKHNSLFVPPLLLVHWVATEGFRIRRFGPALVKLPGIPTLFLAMLVLGPILFYAHWPWIWHDTLKRVGEYYVYHFFQHEHYPANYFNVMWRQPPFPIGFAVGMTGVTTPLPLLGLMVWGLALSVKDGFFTRWTPGSVDGKRRSDAWLLGLFALFPLFVISLPSTPIFGGVKHFMPATPFLCIMAGRALQVALESARPYLALLRQPWVPAVAATLFMLTNVTGILRSHPHGISYYNELIGGGRGAALLGMQRVFWGVASRPLIPKINDVTPPNGRVFFNRTNNDGWRMYVRDGILRQDIAYANGVTESSGGVSFHQWEHEHELYNCLLYTSPSPRD